MKSIGKYTENEFIRNLQLGYDKMKLKGFIELKSNSIACYNCFLFLSIGNFCSYGWTNSRITFVVPQRTLSQSLS